jgi:hypothetical protein
MVGFIEIESNLDEAIERLKRIEKFPEMAKLIIERHLGVIVKDAKEDAPVRTGALRDSIKSLGARIQGDLIKGEIEAGVFYASFVEKRVGFLTDALEGDIQNLVHDLQEAFENLME